MMWTNLNNHAKQTDKQSKYRKKLQTTYLHEWLKQMRFPLKIRENRSL